MTASKDNLRLVENSDRDRWELWSGDEFVGLEGFEILDDNTVVLLHTIIEEKYGRQGYARALVTLLLDELHERGLRIVPVCTYVQRFLERFPEYQPMVDSSRRA